MIPKIYLRRGAEESPAPPPWIFSGGHPDHIEAEEESDFAEGALVEVYTRPGNSRPGHYQGLDRRARALVRAGAHRPGVVEPPHRRGL